VFEAVSSERQGEEREGDKCMKGIVEREKGVEG
jgi:hypothetical protein